MDKIVTADKDDLSDDSDKSIEKIMPKVKPKSASQSRSLAAKSGKVAKGKSIDKRKKGAAPKRPKIDVNSQKMKASE